jgi:hypothetical protein
VDQALALKSIFVPNDVQTVTLAIAAAGAGKRALFPRRRPRWGSSGAELSKLVVASLKPGAWSTSQAYA